MKEGRKLSKRGIIITAVVLILLIAAVLLISRNRAVEMIFDASVDQPVTFRMDEYPGVEFLCDGYTVTAQMNGKEKTYIGGMPIRDLYLCDLNGDGIRELCATVSIGSGFIDTRIVIYDLADDMQFQMEDRFEYHYYLTFEDGKLTANRITDTTANPKRKEETVSGTLTLSDRRLTMQVGSSEIEGKRSSPRISTDTLKKLFEDAISSLRSGGISIQVRNSVPVQYFLDKNEASINADIEKRNDLLAVPLDINGDDEPLLQYLIVLGVLTEDFADYFYYDTDRPDRIFVCTELRDCGYDDIAGYYEALCSGETMAHDDTFVVILEQPGIYVWDSDRDLYSELVG